MAKVRKLYFGDKQLETLYIGGGVLKEAYIGNVMVYGGKSSINISLIINWLGQVKYNLGPSAAVEQFEKNNLQNITTTINYSGLNIVICDTSGKSVDSFSFGPSTSFVYKNIDGVNMNSTMTPAESDSVDIVRLLDDKKYIWKLSGIININVKGFKGNYIGAPKGIYETDIYPTNVSLVYDGANNEKFSIGTLVEKAEIMYAYENDKNREYNAQIKFNNAVISNQFALKEYENCKLVISLGSETNSQNIIYFKIWYVVSKYYYDEHKSDFAGQPYFYDCSFDFQSDLGNKIYINEDYPPRTVISDSTYNYYKNNFYIFDCSVNSVNTSYLNFNEQILLNAITNSNVISPYNGIDCLYCSSKYATLNSNEFEYAWYNPPLDTGWFPINPEHNYFHIFFNGSHSTAPSTSQHRLTVTLRLIISDYYFNVNNLWYDFEAKLEIVLSNCYLQYKTSSGTLGPTFNFEEIKLYVTSSKGGGQIKSDMPGGLFYVETSVTISSEYAINETDYKMYFSGQLDIYVSNLNSVGVTYSTSCVARCNINGLTSSVSKTNNLHIYQYSWNSGASGYTKFEINTDKCWAIRSNSSSEITVGLTN